MSITIESISEQNAVPDLEDPDVAYQSAMSALLNMSLEEKEAMYRSARELIIPGRPLPPGKTLDDMVAGKWPGNETDAEINAALAALS